MISRRLLRIKVLQVLYAYYQSDESELERSQKELFFSISKAYELYFYLLQLVIDVVDYAGSRIEIARNKKIPSYEDLHPNTLFIDNSFIAQLRDNRQMRSYINSHRISWVNNPELIKEIYSLVTGYEGYRQYMEAGETGYANDKKIIIKIFNDIILCSDALHQVLEEKSIYWNDDLDFIVSMIVKTIKKFKLENGENQELVDLFKNDEDKDFVIRLLRESVANRKMCLDLINEKASNWDLDRIAFMDILIMQLAITEMIGFNSIPTKVTLNEFLEIAKYYSTEKSNTFINGVLDKIMQQLKEEKKIMKTGRGLIGEL